MKIEKFLMSVVTAGVLIFSQVSSDAVLQVPGDQNIKIQEGQAPLNMPGNDVREQVLNGDLNNDRVVNVLDLVIAGGEDAPEGRDRRLNLIAEEFGKSYTVEDIIENGAVTQVIRLFDRDGGQTSLIEIRTIKEIEGKGDFVDIIWKTNLTFDDQSRVSGYQATIEHKFYALDGASRDVSKPEEMSRWGIAYYEDGPNKGKVKGYQERNSKWEHTIVRDNIRYDTFSYTEINHLVLAMDNQGREMEYKEYTYKVRGGEIDSIHLSWKHDIKYNHKNHVVYYKERFTGEWYVGEDLHAHAVPSEKEVWTAYAPGIEVSHMTVTYSEGGAINFREFRDSLLVIGDRRITHVRVGVFGFDFFMTEILDKDGEVIDTRESTPVEERRLKRALKRELGNVPDVWQ